MTDKCPYCDFVATNVHDEIAHMNVKHPDVIKRRLDEAGMHTEDRFMTTSCPYCDFTATNHHEQLVHIVVVHPEEIPKSFAQAGIDIADYRQGPDLPSYMTLKELQLVTTFAIRYGLDEFGSLAEDVQVGIHVRDRGKESPMPASWIEFSVGERKFAMWRKNGDLYEVGEDGAVKDEPLHRAN